MAPKQAEGTATVSGTVGSTVPKGSVIAADNGQRYQTLSAVILSAANQVLKIQAVKAGKTGNCTGEKGKWESPLAGVAGKVLVNATLGRDSESDEAFRSRALQTVQKRGMLYGKQGDYAAWARESGAEIVRSWESPNFENTGDLAVLVAGTGLSRVSDGALANARTAIQKNMLAGVAFRVLPALPKVLDFRLDITPDTPDMQAAVRASLNTYITERQKPAAKIALLKLRKYLETNVAGLTSAAIQSPTADIASSQQEIFKLGAVLWT
ncbi:MAG: baseplate J/gp47 family protein [Spirochaetota bacterium]